MEEDCSSDDEEISQLEQLQYMLMNINSNLLSQTICYIQNNFSDTSGKCRQLAYQLLLPVKFHSKSFSLIIQIILQLLDSSSINDSLFELPKFLLSAISQEITSDNIIPYQNSIQAFLFQCYESNIFEIHDIIDIIKVCHDNFSLFNESICSLFCWFAPEIETSDPSFFTDCLESFRFHLQYTETESSYQIVLSNLEQLRENNWHLFRQMRDASESTDPIYQAIRNDDVDQLQTLIFNTHSKFNVHSNSENCEYDIDRQFEMSPFEPSWLMRFRPTGLQIAAFFGSIRCFKFFILQKANPHKKAGFFGCFGGFNGFDSFDGMPLTYFSIASGNSEVIHLTEQLGCHFFSEVLLSSIIFHRYQVFEWLVETKLCGTNDDNVRHLAVLSDNLKVLKYLNEKGELADSADEFKMSLLHYAAKYGSFACLDFMLAIEDEQSQLVFDVNTKDCDCMTPLHYAVKYRRCVAVSVLLSCEKIDVNAKNRNGWTALHFAVSSRNAELVKMLLQKPGIDPNIKNKAMVSPQLMASQMRLDEIKKIFVNMSVMRPKTNPTVLRKRPLTAMNNNNFGCHNRYNRQIDNIGNGGDLNCRRTSTLSPTYSDRKNRPSTTMRITRGKDMNGGQGRRISSSKSNMCENIGSTKEVIVRFELQKPKEKAKLHFPVQNRLQQLHIQKEKRISRTASGSRKQISKFSTTSNLPRAVQIPKIVD